ncbi:uncharacterized protein LOC123013243 [Tribolium madens]|uniref:uncharacterized protein LOC123013243 n=1 Tax=Tribolium madens TaxID=41895 RepID=UPI001CF752B1|nr:uncharacterized protein LOC123013243 [Tribolium madens]
MDENSLMLCIKIVDLFSEYDDFYYYDDGFKYTLEFILINLSQIGEDRTEVVDLFHLLSKILQNTIKSIDDTFQNLFDRERILEIMLKMGDFETLRKCDFMPYALILRKLLDSDFPDTLNGLVSDLFEKLKQHGAVLQLTVITKYTLQRKTNFFCDAFQNVWQWLKEEAPVLLVKCINVDIRENILQILNTVFENCFKHNILTLHFCHKSLRRIVSDICLLTSNIRLRNDSFKLLEFILLEFFDENKILNLTPNEMFSQLITLPEEVNDWAKSNNDIFFCICHLCFCCSRMLWKVSHVLDGIRNRFYSGRNNVKPYVIKSIYYLFPKLTYHDKNVDLCTNMLGDDLLKDFTQLSSCSYLYSNSKWQLLWILEKAPKCMKLMVLGHWLTTIEDNQISEEILLNTIKTTKTESLLLEFILHKNFRKQFGSRSASLLRKLENNEVRRNVALILPFTVDKPTIFSNLILAEPGVPLNSTDSTLLCAIMGAVMPTLNDSQVLKGACVFSSKLLASGKDKPDSVQAFCKNATNIRHLVNITDKVDEETSIEIIRLLKVIILVQQKNRVKFENKLTEDFKIFMKGSSEKVEKGLRLLRHSLTYKHSLIEQDVQSILGLYHIILNNGFISEFQPMVYECLALLYKRKSMLAQTISSAIFIEMSCLSPNKHNRDLLRLLEVWLDVIRAERSECFCTIPEIAIKNFIMRASLDQDVAKKYLLILEFLMKRAHQTKTNNIFY